MLFALFLAVVGLVFWPTIRRALFWGLHHYSDTIPPIFSNFYWAEVDRVLTEDYDREADKEIEDARRGILR